MSTKGGHNLQNKEIKRAYSKGYAKGFNDGQIVEANYNKSKM